ncbi:hypothetical protein EJ03DRAFT_377036 [Teratosphaeria nubilosa]|uniref:Uncharacterized protein n=1 Tax=Teratosphaeria nubilosa TaxID=161662 RepID=A0A6G1L165_9PEZI|nr:hypothetical protein EJ03DRAFT_377036 [Teratosphaeria nubilosa]
MQLITLLPLLSFLSLASANCYQLGGISENCRDWAKHKKPYEWLCPKRDTGNLEAGQGCERETNGEHDWTDAFCCGA